MAAAVITASVPVISTASVAQSAEQAVAPEKNPPGDIPDTQVFIDYMAKAGFSLKVPEGWARSDRSDGASFVDKLDGVVITESQEAAAPTVDSVKAGYIPAMEKSVRAMKVDAIEAVKLPSGSAIRIAYSSNSDPNPVTNKQVRLENQRYLYFKGGRLVSVELYAPLGADNVDQWQMMSQSFRWN
ncbi:MAG: hypothetical protein IH582_09925 [Afipia sp.]|nr:hypothetical protein [Afipia sp.]